jgi:hypothetical protein
MGEKRNEGKYIQGSGGKLNEREHLEDLGIGRKLQWVFK